MFPLIIIPNIMPAWGHHVLDPDQMVPERHIMENKGAQLEIFLYEWVAMLRRQAVWIHAVVLAEIVQGS